MRQFKTLDDLPEDLTGKKVLVRVDLNVPMDGAKVTDDTRLKAMLPTVLELSDRGAIVLLLSHFGWPGARSGSSRIAKGRKPSVRSRRCFPAISAFSRTRASTAAKKTTIRSS